MFSVKIVHSWARFFWCQWRELSYQPPPINSRRDGPAAGRRGDNSSHISQKTKTNNNRKIYRKKIEERGSLNTFEWHVVCSPNIPSGERIKKTKREKENNPRQNSSTKPTTAQQLLLFRRNFMGKQGGPSRKAAAIFIRFLFFLFIRLYINVICEFVYYYSLVKRFTQRHRK